MPSHKAETLMKAKDSILRNFEALKHRTRWSWLKLQFQENVFEVQQ